MRVSAAGDARPLEGLGLGVKDMFATKDVRTTAGSHILDNFCRPTSRPSLPISGATAR